MTAQSRQWTNREGPVHQAVLGYLRAVLPGAMVHHSPGEFGMSGDGIARQIAKHKHMGMIVGWPDLTVLTEAGPLFIEVKAEGGSLSGSQKDCHAAMAALGYRVAVVRGVDDCRERLAAWGVPARES